MICKNCLKDTMIVNKHFFLCFKCNSDRLNVDKSKSLTFGFKRKKQRQNNQKLRDTRERDMFLEIWDERPHYCSNLNCGRFLGIEPKAIFFSHDKPKSIYPELRLVKKNVSLLCDDCHYIWDFGDKSKIIFNR